MLTQLPPGAPRATPGPRLLKPTLVPTWRNAGDTDYARGSWLERRRRCPRCRQTRLRAPARGKLADRGAIGLQAAAPPAEAHVDDARRVWIRCAPSTGTPPATTWPRGCRSPNPRTCRAPAPQDPAIPAKPAMPRELLRAPDDSGDARPRAGAIALLAGAEHAARRLRLRHPSPGWTGRGPPLPSFALAESRMKSKPAASLPPALACKRSGDRSARLWPGPRRSRPSCRS